MFRGLADDGVTHGRFVVEGVGLVEQADPDAAAHRHPARIRLPLPGEHRKQAGFAVAVAPHDADPVALVHTQGDGVEDDLGRVLEV